MFRHFSTFHFKTDESNCCLPEDGWTVLLRTCNIDLTNYLCSLGIRGKRRHVEPVSEQELTFNRAGFRCENITISYNFTVLLNSNSTHENRDFLNLTSRLVTRTICRYICQRHAFTGNPGNKVKYEISNAPEPGISSHVSWKKDTRYNTLLLSNIRETEMHVLGRKNIILWTYTSHARTNSRVE